MQELGTDTNLYALVFGESVLNDAVSFCHYVIDIPYSCRVHVLVKGKSCLLGDFFFFFVCCTIGRWQFLCTGTYSELHSSAAMRKLVEFCSK